MNRNFFRTLYSKKLKFDLPQYVQSDGYVYAVSKANSNLLLVIDDITNNKENFKKLGGSRAFEGVDCIDFVDKGIMTKHTYNLNYDINYIYNFTGTYESYDKNRFNFTIEEIKDNEIISSLRKVFYFLQPTLQSRTLVGGGEENTVTDPNFYEGYYYLKNGEEYTILKYRSTIYFYIGNIPYNHILNKEEEKTGCIYKEEIDFELYSKAIRLQEIKRTINYCTSELLDYKYNELKSLIKEYELLKTELKQINY